MLMHLGPQLTGQKSTPRNPSSLKVLMVEAPAVTASTRLLIVLLNVFLLLHFVFLILGQQSSRATYSHTHLELEDLSVEITCLCRVLILTDNDFHLILGFNSSLQTTLFTLNLDSRKGYIDVHTQLCCQLEFGTNNSNLNSDLSYIYIFFQAFKNVQPQFVFEKYTRAICF